MSWNKMGSKKEFWGGNKVGHTGLKKDKEASLLQDFRNLLYANSGLNVEERVQGDSGDSNSCYPFRWTQDAGRD